MKAQALFLLLAVIVKSIHGVMTTYSGKKIELSELVSQQIKESLFSVTKKSESIPSSIKIESETESP